MDAWHADARTNTEPGRGDRYRGTIIDTGRVQLRACDLSAVSFRSRDEGWATDLCGQAFRTTDGGVSFRPVAAGKSSLTLEASGWVERFEWISDQRAIAFGVRDANFLLTSDGGATWKRSVSRWPDDGIDATDHFANTAWACGSSGRIFRTRDAGATFSRTRSTPFDADHRCWAISFIDQRHGWAGGELGALFETRDGGDHWTRMQPLPLPRRPTGAITSPGNSVPKYEVKGVLRLSMDRGWVLLEGSDSKHRAEVEQAFYTADAGAIWSVRDEDPPLRLQGAGPWGDGVVLIHDDHLQFHDGGRTVRETPLVEQRTAAPEVIVGAEDLGAHHLIAWTAHTVVESFDSGASWSMNEPDRVAYATIRRVDEVDGRTLLELTDGAILELNSGSAPGPSEQPEFDRFLMDRAQARRRGLPPPPTPMSCLLQASSGDLSVNVSRESEGCWKAKTRLLWNPKGASVQGDEKRTKQLSDLRAVCVRSTDGSDTSTGKGGAATPTQGEEQTRPLSEADLRTILRAIVEAVERTPADLPWCVGGRWAHVSVELDWRCGNGPRMRASLTESECRAEGEPPKTGPVYRIIEVVARALEAQP